MPIFEYLRLKVGDIMKKEALAKCPICSEQVTVTNLHCEYCDTKIQGSFYMCNFCELDSDQKKFLEVFIQCRGNLKEVEKETGFSYHMVRNKIDAIVSVLKGNFEKKVTNKEEIIDKISSGEITPMDAVDLLS